MAGHFAGLFGSPSDSSLFFHENSSNSLKVNVNEKKIVGAKASVRLVSIQIYGSMMHSKENFQKIMAILGQIENKAVWKSMLCRVGHLFL